jgi:MHS family shikimate/dehydroshikimate transporter-like MFS transporter
MLPDSDFMSWGWRIPFLASIVLAVFGVVVRSRLEDTPVFNNLKKDAQTVRFPLLQTVRTHPGAILRVIGVAMGVSVWGYLIQSFVLSYGTTNLDIDKSVLLWAIGCAAALELLTIPFWGWLSDRVGRRKVMLTGVALTMVYVLPFFWLLETRNTVLIWVAIIIGLPILKDLIFGPMAALVAEMFTSNVRFSGVSAGREIGTAIFGGTAPFIGIALIEAGSGQVWLLALYIVFALLVTGFAVLVGTDHSQQELQDIGGAPADSPASEPDLPVSQERS